MKFNEIDIDKLKVSGNRILVRKKRPEKTDGWKKHGNTDIVVAVNTEVGEKEPDNIAEVVSYPIDFIVYTKDGEYKVSKGDFVIHQPFTGFGFKNGDYDYTILSENDVLAVL